MIKAAKPTRYVIPGFPGYGITKTGQVWSRLRRTFQNRMVGGKWLKSCSIHGYRQVVLSLNGKPYHRYIHHLVLLTLVGMCPAGMECRHLDGDPANNNLDNLCWGTKYENQKDRVKHGTNRRGRRKLTEENIRDIRRVWQGRPTQKSLADRYGVCQNTISQILLRKTWKYT